MNQTKIIVFTYSELNEVKFAVERKIIELKDRITYYSENGQYMEYAGREELLADAKRTLDILTSAIEKFN